MARIDEGQAALVKAFETGKGREKDLCAITKDPNIRSVGSL
jgi:ribonuclease H2 subunit A